MLRNNLYAEMMKWSSSRLLSRVGGLHPEVQGDPGSKLDLSVRSAAVCLMHATM